MSDTATGSSAFCDQPRARAVGKVTEALETIERTRGHLYSFHQLIGRADLMLDDAVTQLRKLGQGELAEHISHDLVGRNALPGRWSFQVVEDYDDGYYQCFQEVERLVRRRLTGGRRHAYETQLKQRRHTPGQQAHTADPKGVN